ncbi:MAG: YdjY domain-containing protein [Planctomycetota bacterium]|nr:YdjY domain-containing protein [Planctomycetota bacterium]
MAENINPGSGLGVAGLAFFAITLSVGSMINWGDGERPAPQLHVDVNNPELRIKAVTSLWGFEGSLSPFPGYHFLCWKDGRASPLALLTTEFNDADIQAGLQKLGGQSGDNLSQETWDERHSATSKAANLKVEGSRIEVLVESSSGSRFPLKELIAVPEGRAPDIRLGGHMKYRPSWLSGCILCLVSCPGGRLSNASYTCHDYAKGDATHKITERGRAVFQSGAEVTVIFRVAEKEPK